MKNSVVAPSRAIPACTHPKERLEAAGSYAKENLAALAGEMLDWQRSGILPGGTMLGELMDLCRPVAGPAHAQSMALKFVTDAALHYVVAPGRCAA